MSRRHWVRGTLTLTVPTPDLGEVLPIVSLIGGHTVATASDGTAARTLAARINRRAGRKLVAVGDPPPHDPPDTALDGLIAAAQRSPTRPQ